MIFRKRVKITLLFCKKEKISIFFQIIRGIRVIFPHGFFFIYDSYFSGRLGSLRVVTPFLMEQIIVREQETADITFLTSKSLKVFHYFFADPDQPSRSEPKESEWVHWLVNNMDGISVYSGDTIVKYLTPKPENGTGMF